MYTKSLNTMIVFDTDEIIKELFKSLVQRYAVLEKKYMTGRCGGWC